MIASLRGKISYLTPQLRKDSYAVIDVQGVGYKVFSAGRVVTKLHEGDDVTFYTYLAVSENALDLYGFLEPTDKTFFSLLLSVPGIGPKTALSVLDKASLGEVQEATLSNNPQLLVQTSGLSIKMAEKIVVALKDKAESLTPRGEAGVKSGDADAFAVLLSFGYSSGEARAALNKIEGDVTATSDRVRAALKILSKDRK